MHSQNLENFVANSLDMTEIVYDYIFLTQKICKLVAFIKIHYLVYINIVFFVLGLITVYSDLKKL